MDPAGLELIYALSRHPQRISTFVNGEAAVLAGRVGRLRIVSEKRSSETDPRPGGIPSHVDVQWTPKRSEAAFWAGAIQAAARGPARLLAELQDVTRPVPSFTAKRRWAYSALAASAYAARLPPWAGRRHLHAHFAATGGVVAHAASRVLRTPYSVTVHGSADLFRHNPHLDMLARDAALVVAVSRHHRDVLLDRVPELDPRKVAVIHVGVRTDELRSAAKPVDRRGDGSVRIVSVANLGPTKGMSVLIDSVARLIAAERDVRLDIVGEGPMRDALERQIAHLGLGERVRLAGAVTPDQAHAAMREADVFALACVRTPEGSQDGIPTVLMEAMASGRPVVSTRLSGIPELIEDGRTGWLADPGDADDFAVALAAALDAPEESARRAREGREHVRLRFDQERNALALLDAILSVHEEGSGPQKASR